MYYSWATKKTANGYAWTVTQNQSRKTPNCAGLYVDHEIVKLGERKTRAQASGTAKRWQRFFTAQLESRAVA